MDIFQVDAFTDHLFRGNPAAVIPLKEWLSDGKLQQIAAENNLSETAFFVPMDDGGYHLRWFTPEREVDLCGHATLAAAHVLFHHLDHQGTAVTFHSKSGPLRVDFKNDLLWLDFPTRDPRVISCPEAIPEAIGAVPIQTAFHTDLLVLVDSEATLRSIQPNYQLLKGIDARGVIVTAKGSDCDFVSRFFAPGVGVPEDPVTGSAHTVLIPFWGKKLKKKTMTARQLSARGGELFCGWHGDRVTIGGSAVTYLQGTIQIG
ncbi:MAG: PhzF family phenazine biosynthesis protein [Balneolaceae bacterium]